MRLRPAFEGCDVNYVTVRKAYAADLDGERLYVVRDATRWDKFGLVRMALKLCWILLRVRPHVIVSTGAAPGYFAIRLGKLIGAKTVWLDSIANVEHISMTGELVGKRADLWLTQWPHLERSDGPRYKGAVI